MEFFKTIFNMRTWGTSGDMRMASDLQLVNKVPRNAIQLLNINTTKFQVEREPVYVSVVNTNYFVIINNLN